MMITTQKVGWCSKWLQSCDTRRETCADARIVSCASPCTESAICSMSGVIFHHVHHLSGMRFWARLGITQLTWFWRRVSIG